MYNLFLDDIRESKCLGDTRTWEVVRSYQAFVDKITKDGLPRFISFDHDLADGQYPKSYADQFKPIDYNEPKWKENTGYHCAKFVIRYCEERGLEFPNYQVHSMNPVGRQNIISLIESYKKSKL